MDSGTMSILTFFTTNSEGLAPFCPIKANTLIQWAKLSKKYDPSLKWLNGLEKWQSFVQERGNMSHQFTCRPKLQGYNFQWRGFSTTFRSFWLGGRKKQ